jgi:glycosyltransferase involved in cell wall biosynthesis
MMRITKKNSHLQIFSLKNIYNKIISCLLVPFFSSCLLLCCRKFVGTEVSFELVIVILFFMIYSSIIPHEKSNHTDTTIPHKLFQYLYANRYVLVSDCVPLIRIIKETKGGDVYCYNSHEELAIKLKEAQANKRELETSELILKKYNWQVDEKKLIQLYEDLQKNG